MDTNFIHVKALSCYLNNSGDILDILCVLIAKITVLETN